MLGVDPARQQACRDCASMQLGKQKEEVSLPSLGCRRAEHCMLSGAASSSAAEQRRVVTILRESNIMMILANNSSWLPAQDIQRCLAIGPEIETT